MESRASPLGLQRTLASPHTYCTIVLKAGQIQNNHRLEVTVFERGEDLTVGGMWMKNAWMASD